MDKDPRLEALDMLLDSKRSKELERKAYEATKRSVRAMKKRKEGDPKILAHDRRDRPGRKRVQSKSTKPRVYKSRWELRHVIAWDGEGVTLEDNEHIYTLLSNSENAYLASDKGLSTKDCLEFFLTHNNRRAIHVIYGGSYDVNMILRDLSRAHIATLWTEGAVRWKGYKICYAPRKRFSVTRLNTYGKVVGDTFVLWDVIGFFQRAFVNACRKWKIGDEEELREIETMKLMRSEFNIVPMDDVRAYNAKECELLVKLMVALLNAMDRAGIKLKRFDGAGAIASFYLAKWKVTEHMGSIPDWVYRASQVAYSGGRIEAIKYGTHMGPVYEYDINSAYPTAARNLPSLKTATWEWCNEWDGDPLSIVDIKWHIRGERPFYPLWYRLYDGTILYPQEGRGMYYGWEAALMRDYFEYGLDYEIKSAINLNYGECSARPFEAIDDEYAFRAKLKREDDSAEHAVKLGLNSVYGKLAQQEGYKKDGRSDAPKFPTYHNLIWAGAITSYTRSLMYRMAAINPESVICFATDALITTEEINSRSLRLGSGLGEWSLDNFGGIVLVQPGVYWLKEPDHIIPLEMGRKHPLVECPLWDSKYRGFDPGSLSREGILKAWRKGERNFTAQTTRFCGMGTSLARSDFHSVWRRWLTEPRQLDILVNGKRQPIEWDTKQYATRLIDTYATINYWYDGPSHPYRVKWMDGVGPSRPMIDGVDARVWEHEWEDSHE